MRHLIPQYILTPHRRRRRETTELQFFARRRHTDGTKYQPTLAELEKNRPKFHELTMDFHIIYMCLAILISLLLLP
jgi:hypothetical protein